MNKIIIFPVSRALWKTEKRSLLGAIGNIKDRLKKKKKENEEKSKHFRSLFWIQLWEAGKVHYNVDLTICLVIFIKWERKQNWKD